MKHTRSTFSVLFYLNTGKKKKSGKCPIVGRISVDGKNTSFSTGLEIEQEHWDAGSGSVAGKSKENTVINKQIENYKSEVGKHYCDMLENRGFVTAESLKNALQGIGTNQNTVMQEFADFLEEKRKSIGIRISENTYIQYSKGYRHLKDYLRDKQGTNDIPFGKVDIALIENYAYYLKIDLQLAARSVHSYLAPFRTVVRRAFNRGLLRQYPFSEYMHEKEIVKRRYLSGDELERLMKVDLKGAALNFIRDMFLFSTFTGLSYSDLKNLQHSHFRQQEDGNRWIVLNRKKTGTASHIPLLDIPLQIIDKYNGTKFSGTEGYVFKVRTKENMNFQLKKIAKAARIDRRLTWHQSRHSFSTTVCLSNGVPIESLSQMLGHLSIKTTQIYAQVTRTKINEDMTRLEKRIEGKYKLAENESKIIETKNLL